MACHNLADLVSILLIIPPTRVKNKLGSAGNPPLLTEYEVYMKLKSSKKPKSGIPSDIPRELIQEFSPEIA